MVRVGVLLGILFLVMVPALLASSPRSIQVHTAAGDMVWCSSVNQNDSVQLQFTHSMYGGYVREQWKVTPNNQLQRVRFVTQNAAAAEYYATDGTSYRAEDGFVVPADPLQQPELIVRVNDRGNHVLSTDDDTAHLAELIPNSTQVRIAVMAKSCDHES